MAKRTDLMKLIMYGCSNALLILYLMMNLFLSKGDLEKVFNTGAQWVTSVVEEPNTAQLVLSVGEDSSQMLISWVSPLNAHNDVEYMKAENYDGKEENFSKQATTVSMQKKPIRERDAYLYQATLTQLKSDTEYVYRIVRRWPARSSEVMKMKTCSKDRLSIAVLGDPQIGANQTVDTNAWLATADAISKHNVDCIYSMGDNIDNIGEQDFILACAQCFCEPPLFKQRPLMTVKGNHEGGLYDSTFDYANENSVGDYYIVYEEAVIVGLNNNVNAYAEHREVMEAASEQAQGKWLIVTMHKSVMNNGLHSDDEELKDMRPFYTKMFTEMDVDLVLSGHDHIYNRSKWMMDEIPSQKEETNIKEPGEVLYVTMGSSTGNKCYGAQAENKHADWVEYAYSEQCAMYLIMTMDKSKMHLVTYRVDSGDSIDSLDIEHAP